MVHIVPSKTTEVGTTDLDTQEFYQKVHSISQERVTLARLAIWGEARPNAPLTLLSRFGRHVDHELSWREDTLPGQAKFLTHLIKSAFLRLRKELGKNSQLFRF